jgi:pimeloyl-ACP methyl ester carboxylesterase
MRSTRSRFRLLAAVAVAAMTFAIVPALGAATAGASVQPVLGPRVVWQACAAGSAAAQAGGFTCARILVPLDYQDPGGPQIKLALVRHAATGPARRGVIFINPGGPGGAGTFQIPAWIGFMPAVLLRDYDIVSWDPRGIGQSTAVQCFPNAAAETAFLGNDADFPVASSQQAGFIGRWAAFGKICAARNGDLLKHVSTADTARDLDLLRRALGQPKLNYIGLSYGTYLGATYANLFPRHVGRMVLDGSIAPTAWTNGGQPNASRSLSMRIGSTTWVAKTLTAFLSICGQRSTQQCAFSAGSPAATTAKWDAVLNQLRQEPITLGGTVITYTDIVADVGDALDVVQPHASPVTNGSIQGWSRAVAALQEIWDARNNKAGTSPAPAPSASASVESYAGPEQGLAVECGDAPSPPASAFPGLQRLVFRSGGGVISLPDLWGDEACSTWPVAQLDTYRGPWNAPTSPILVIGNTTDPATPLQDSVVMSHELANARLLVVDGYGHTEFLNPSTCAATYETAYFLTGALPPAGTICQPNEAPFAQAAS